MSAEPCKGEHPAPTNYCHSPSQPFSPHVQWFTAEKTRCGCSAATCRGFLGANVARDEAEAAEAAAAAVQAAKAAAAQARREKLRAERVRREATAAAAAAAGLLQESKPADADTVSTFVPAPSQSALASTQSVTATSSLSTASA